MSVFSDGLDSIMGTLNDSQQIAFFLRVKRTLINQRNAYVNGKTQEEVVSYDTTVFMTKMGELSFRADMAKNRIENSSDYDFGMVV